MVTRDVEIFETSEISSRGPAGPTGPTGASGPRGLTGATGPTGQTGATGPSSGGGGDSIKPVFLTQADFIYDADFDGYLYHVPITTGKLDSNYFVVGPLTQDSYIVASKLSDTDDGQVMTVVYTEPLDLVSDGGLSLIPHLEDDEQTAFSAYPFGLGLSGDYPLYQNKNYKFSQSIAFTKVGTTWVPEVTFNSPMPYEVNSYLGIGSFGFIGWLKEIKDAFQYSGLVGGFYQRSILDGGPGMLPLETYINSYGFPYQRTFSQPNVAVNAYAPVSVELPGIDLLRGLGGTPIVSEITIYDSEGSCSPTNTITISPKTFVRAARMCGSQPPTLDFATRGNAHITLAVDGGSDQIFDLTTDYDSITDLITDLNSLTTGCTWFTNDSVFVEVQSDTDSVTSSLKFTIVNDGMANIGTPWTDYYTGGNYGNGIALHGFSGADTIDGSSNPIVLDSPCASVTLKIRKPGARFGFGTGDWIDSGWVTVASNPPLNKKITTLSTTSTVSPSVRYIRGDTTSGNVTLTLPTCVGVPGRELIIKKIASANSLTIDPAGSETIDGSSTLVLTTLNSTARLISNGTNWELW